MASTASGQRGGAPAAAARWFIVALLSVIAACLVIEAGWGTSAARAQPSVGAAGRLIAVAGKVTGETYGVYLIDLNNGTIGVYQYLSGKKRLRLLAVRNYTFDAQLDEYNTEPPVREIKKLVQQHRRLTDTK